MLFTDLALWFTIAILLTLWLITLFRLLIWPLQCPEIAGPSIKFHFLHSDGSLVSFDAETTTDVHQILRRHEVRIILLEQVPWDAGDMSSHLKRKTMDVVDHSRTKTLRYFSRILSYLKLLGYAITVSFHIVFLLLLLWPV